MPGPNSISADKLVRLIGTERCPVLIDLRSDDAFAAAPKLLPGARRLPFAEADRWTASYTGWNVVVLGEADEAVVHAAAAMLRQQGAQAEMLEGGFAAWSARNHPLIATKPLPQRDAQGRTLWVTRARPKVDRIACPWLIRRFIDWDAQFLFVPAAEVASVAAVTGATPFDVEGTFWSHRGERCTFDTLIEEFGLSHVPGLARLAPIVRGADTAQLGLAPEAPGLLALSLGLSRLHADDHEQLEAGMHLYDALYRWARDAFDETHDWSSHVPPAKRVRA